jgi:endonuclease I
MKRIIAFVAILIVTISYAKADYLIVSRSATIKEHPNIDANILLRVSKKDTLLLLDDGVQQNGYYHVSVADSINGWIYRSLVRRYRGNPFAIGPTSSTFISAWETHLPDDYYTGTENLTGADLKQALNEIIRGHREFPYTSTSTDVWDILKETDRDPNYPNNIILLYTGRSRNAAQEYNNGNGWTREHVWAKSHGDFGTSTGAGTDVHHLRPVDASVNSTRNNKDFDDGGIEYIDGNFHTGCLRDVDSWEPRDSEKGDVARMIFYMAVRYEGQGDEPDLELSDEVNTAPDALHGKLSTLLEWHELDPVDNWERRRNDIIYIDYQGNRNPFIDHPEYVRLIWSNN